VRFPIERGLRRLEATHTVRIGVVDCAQEFCHVPHFLRFETCDLFLAVARGYHPLGIAFYSRILSLEQVQKVLSHGLRSGEMDIPILRFTAPFLSRMICQVRSLFQPWRQRIIGTAIRRWGLRPGG